MTVRILIGDVRARLAEMPAESVHCVVTSPPYWGLRDYGVAGQIGMEPTPAEHIAVMVEVFRAVRRVLRRDGTLWLNYGDCYASSVNGRSAADTKAAGTDDRTFRDKPFSTAVGGLKPKDLVGMPWRLALALQEDGWWLRSDIIWHKPNPMPESISDRPASAHEHMFLLARSERYFYDAEAVRTPAVSETRKMPDGWDTGPGGHGSHHRNGRERGRSIYGRHTLGDAVPAAEQREKIRGLTPRHQGHVNHTGIEDTPRGSANLRNVWTIATAPFSEAHFATFPPALVEPCIKAGTSEHGACSSCGAPWRRRVGDAVAADGRKSGNLARVPGQERISGASHVGRGFPWQPTTTPTLGWEPTCACTGAGVVPCTVLEPFGGAGTTGLVADRLRRDAILIELNPDYAEIARKRIERDSGMFSGVTVAA